MSLSKDLLFPCSWDLRKNRLSGNEVKQESDLQLGVCYGCASQLYALLIPTLPVLICDCYVWLGSSSPFSVGCVMRVLMSRGTCTCDGVRWPEVSSPLSLSTLSIEAACLTDLTQQFWLIYIAPHPGDPLWLFPECWDYRWLPSLPDVSVCPRDVTSCPHTSLARPYPASHLLSSCILLLRPKMKQNTL